MLRRGTSEFEPEPHDTAIKVWGSVGFILLLLSGMLGCQEYETLHSGAWFKTLLEGLVWKTVAVLAVLGLAALANAFRLVFSSFSSRE